MKTRLVTDSTADLPSKYLAQYRIEVIPAILVMEGKSFADGKDISRADFYTRMPAMQTPATTAAPSSGSFKACYKKLFAEGAEKIISLHAASNLSGIFNAARLAAESFGKRVEVIDSRQLSLGMGFQLLALGEKIAKGEQLENLIDYLKQFRERLKLIAVLDTLEYLRRSGRVSWAKARLGSLLNLKPMIELSEGQVENLGAVRTTRLANLRLQETLEELNTLENLAILHTNAEDRARAFLDALSPNLAAPPLIVNVTTAIGAHLGPNGLGFAAITKQLKDKTNPMIK